MNDLLGLLDMETRAGASGGQQETNGAGKSEHYFLSANSKWQLIRTRSTFQCVHNSSLLNVLFYYVKFPLHFGITTLLFHIAGIHDSDLTIHCTTFLSSDDD